MILKISWLKNKNASKILKITSNLLENILLDF